MDNRLLRDLEILTRAIEDGGWREVRVVGPNVSVLLSQDREAGAVREPSTPTRPVAPALAVQGEASVVSPVGDVPIDPAWMVVSAPSLGTFYRSPKPGTPAFVEVGQKIAVGAELCLIEVMKLFTSVRAEFGGAVRRIAVGDGELVEGGQALIYIEGE